MFFMILGLALWALAHALPVVARDRRAALIESFGEKPYKIGFALTIVAAIVFIALGWRSMDFVPVYDPPSWGRQLAVTGMVIAFLLFGAAKGETVVKRTFRHPQLTGVFLWALFHLAANGDLRSVLLFGFMALWSAATMVMLNRRDGEWVRPERVGLMKTLKNAAISFAVFIVFALLHEWLFGVNPFVA